MISLLSDCLHNKLWVMLNLFFLVIEMDQWFSLKIKTYIPCEGEELKWVRGRGGGGGSWSTFPGKSNLLKWHSRITKNRHRTHTLLRPLNQIVDPRINLNNICILHNMWLNPWFKRIKSEIYSVLKCILRNTHRATKSRRSQSL